MIFLTDLIVIITEYNVNSSRKSIQMWLTTHSGMDTDRCAGQYENQTPNWRNREIIVEKEKKKGKKKGKRMSIEASSSSTTVKGEKAFYCREWVFSKIGHILDQRNGHPLNYSASVSILTVSIHFTLNSIN